MLYAAFLFWLVSFCYAVFILKSLKVWCIKDKNLTANTSSNTPLPKVALIIAVRNEVQHIQRLIQQLQNQTYPNSLQIIFVDDFSTDHTLQVLRNTPNVTSISLADHLPAQAQFTPNKKKALELGINHTNAEIIITTDGDCWPKSETWLQTMVESAINQNADMVCAPVFYKKQEGLFQKFLQLDLVAMAAITKAAIEFKQPNMCNGGNLLFRKSTFKAVGGYADAISLPSGDDLFLLHRFKAFNKNIVFNTSPEAVVITHPPQTLKHFYHQRKRWLSKTFQFKQPLVTFTLLVSYALNLYLLLGWLPIVFKFNKIYFIFYITSILLKAITELLLLSTVAKRYHLQYATQPYPIHAILHLIYVVTMGALSNFGSYHWKGRTIK